MRTSETRLGRGGVLNRVGEANLKLLNRGDGISSGGGGNGGDGVVDVLDDAREPREGDGRVEVIGNG